MARISRTFPGLLLARRIFFIVGNRKRGSMFCLIEIRSGLPPTIAKQHCKNEVKSMSKILTEVLKANEGYAASFTKGDLALPPARGFCGLRSGSALALRRPKVRSASRKTCW